MNINNFEKHIDKRILERGYDYYNDGNIVEVYKQTENEYIFDIEGSEEYEVIIKINNNGEIIGSNCDCPYSFGPICKHEVAAYYKLFEINNSKLQKNIERKPMIKDILQELTKDELVKIIEEIANNDKVFKNTIMFKYSKDNNINNLDSCEKFMDLIINKHSDRSGFISYEYVEAFVNDLDELLVKIKSVYEEDKNYLLALDIIFAVLGKGIELFDYTDDSGELGMFIDNVIYLIEDIVYISKNIDINEREILFLKLLEESDSDIFYGWEEYSIEIIGLMSEFLDVEIFRAKLKMKLEYMINYNNSSDNNERLLSILFDIIKKYETKDDEDKFIRENLKFTSFRELLIDKLIKEKNYLRVIELALEGELKDKENLGLALKWKKIRYESYKELSNQEEQKKLAEELLISGEFEYYKDLKILNKEKEDVFYSDIKNKLLCNKGWNGRNIYIKLIVFENDLEEVMKVVREDISKIEVYSDMLKDKYEDEVTELYIKYIEIQASRASDRNQYRDVCRIIEKFGKISDNNKVEEINNKLRKLYKKRPAFIDELSRV